MAAELGDAIRMYVQEKGVAEELVLKTIEDSILAAYKRKFGTDENAVVRFNEEGTEVTVFAKKRIVEDEELEDPVEEISLPEALELNEDCELGDELLIEINPKDFDRVSVQSAKQKARQTFREIHKDTLYSEYKDKEGEMIIGYYQRERNGNIFVDLGKTEGIMPKKYQSPREVYHPNDRIKAMIYEVNKTPTGLQIVLTRTHTEFVKRIFELEVPEVYDKTVEIFKIVREQGYRTKLAVYSTREDVDPVGACVGLKGVRIQSIVRELEGEKIDILKYDNDPRTFIKNALSPAEVAQIVLLDEGKRQALAIVPDSQLSLAIGKQGLNVRLANRLADWNIDVKTETQFAEMDVTAASKKAAAALFGEAEEEITLISELPDISDGLVALLKDNKIELIEDLVALTDDALTALTGITPADVETIRRIIADNVEIIEEEARAAFPQEDGEAPEEEAGEGEAFAEGDAQEGFAEAPAQGEAQDETGAEARGEAQVGAEENAGENSEEDSEEDAGEEVKYECPECNSPITLDMTSCPNCGVGLSFEVEDGEADEEG